MVLPKDTNITPRKYPTIPLGDDFIKQSPADHFEDWFNDAIKKNVKEPDALILSTYDGKRVNARTVALRGFEKGEKEKGIFYIYTNYNSAKSKEIEKTKDVSLTFYWPDVFRQIRIIGQAKNAVLSKVMNILLHDHMGHKSERGLLDKMKNYHQDKNY